MNTHQLIKVAFIFEMILIVALVYGLLEQAGWF